MYSKNYIFYKQYLDKKLLDGIACVPLRISSFWICEINLRKLCFCKLNSIIRSQIVIQINERVLKGKLEPKVNFPIVKEDLSRNFRMSEVIYQDISKLLPPLEKI